MGRIGSTLGRKGGFTAESQRPVVKKACRKQTEAQRTNQHHDAPSTCWPTLLAKLIHHGQNGTFGVRAFIHTGAADGT